MGLFLFYFRSFQTNNTIFPTNQCEKYPSRIWCRDSNPQPLEHESSPITIRPGLPPSKSIFLSFKFAIVRSHRCKPCLVCPFYWCQQRLVTVKEDSYRNFYWGFYSYSWLLRGKFTRKTTFRRLVFCTFRRPSSLSHHNSNID